MKLRRGDTIRYYVKNQKQTHVITMGTLTFFPHDSSEFIMLYTKTILHEKANKDLFRVRFIEK
jgi:hypothetical protein